MDKKYYKVSLDKLTDCESFTEASREELRTLLALMAAEGEADAALAKLAGVSEARLSSALTLWQSSGVIRELSEKDDEAERSGHAAGIRDEFEYSPIGERMMETSAACAAEYIRDEALAELIGECAKLMGRPVLNSQEIKWICAISSQLKLSHDYILTLAAHLADRGRLTATNLKNKAEQLVSMSIDTTEDLERYIMEKATETSDDWEYRHLLGIYNRNLTKYEKSYFKRWSAEFGYSVGIVGEAYDICVQNTGKLSLAYMNKLLSAWHDGGARTVEDCRKLHEQEKTERAKKASVGERRNAHPESEVPKYAEFDTEDALLRALKRSYGDNEGASGENN